MTDSTISAMVAATLPLTSEAVPCVQGGTNKQAPAAAFGIPVVGSATPTALAEFQTWIDNSHDPARVLMYLNGSWVELYQIADDGTLTVSTALVLPGDPAADLEAATKHYVDSRVATAPGALIFRGMIDCSTTPPPDYPAANQGDFYVVSHAGQIGGTSGANAATGDMLLCRVNGTASGSQSGAGLNWVIGQGKIQNAAAGPGAAASGDFAQFDGTSGTLLKDGGLSLDTDAAMAANSDSRIPSQKAVKSQIGGKPLANDTLVQGQVWTWDGTSSFRACDNEGDNLIVNPSFESWQESIAYTLSSTVPKTHIGDFWKASGGANNGRTVAHIRSRFTNRSAVVFQRPSGFADSGRFRLMQQFEQQDALYVAGRTVMVSFDFYVGANYSPSNGPYVTLYWGGGNDEDIDLRSTAPAFPANGGFASSASLTPQIAAYNSYSRIVAGPFAIPATVGLSAARVSEVAVEISSGDYSSPSGSDDSFVIGDVKMEYGNVATPFRKPDLAATYQRAFRRYQSTFKLGTIPVSGTGSNTGELMFRRATANVTSEGIYVPLPCRMRVTPGVTLYNPIVSANNQVHNITSNADCTASAADFLSDHGFRVTCTGNSGGAAGNWLSVHYVADARL